MEEVEKEKPTVLLIEDDVLLVKMYQTKFAMEGFDFITAQDGEEGLRVALEKYPDFIILDVMMPKMSGLDLLEKLRQNPKGKEIGVIVLTNLTQEQESQRAKELGVKEYLTKADLTPKDVVEKVKQHLAS